MKACSVFLGLVGAMLSLGADVARGFSISAVTVSPSNVVPANTEVRLIVDIVTPSQGTWLYAPTQISSNANGIRVDIFPTSGMLTAIGALRETVNLGVLPAGTHHYEVAIHPNFTVNWGTRTNRGSFDVSDGGEAVTTVAIEARQPIAEESSYPYRRLPFRGMFTISRDGPTNGPLNVFVHYSGTATPGVDYPALPFLVTIPAGAAFTTLDVAPIDDGKPEGLEMVIATLSHCPPDTNPPMGIPCYGGFELATGATWARVFIRDDGITEASLAITNPVNGASFSAGQTIPIDAIAIDLNGYIHRVEFWNGDTLIGVSDIAFVRAPDPGTPIFHTFEWRGAPAGDHVLTARAMTRMDPLGDDTFRVVSQPVHITVTSVSNRAPHSLFVSPTNTAEFPPNVAVEIVADTQDPDGWVPRMEFFADGLKIGESRIEFIQAPEPGQWQTFGFVWQAPPPGRHTLTVRATDNQGATATSSPVEISIGTSELLPIVTVTAPDCFAAESGSDAVLNTATFRIRRFGPTNDALVVAYSLRGTAENGTDYETLAGLATIAAGSRFVDVLVRPIADKLPEGIESIALRVEEPPPPSPEIRVINPYRAGRPSVAVAVISDGPWPALNNGAQCVPLTDGFRYVCFAAETGRTYRLEGSVDLRTWQTLFTTLCSDGALHFVDAEAVNHLGRFYRLTPEPVEPLAE